MSTIQLSEFKTHLNITRTNDDAELQRTLDSAEGWVNHHTAGHLGGGTITLTARSLAGCSLVLPAARLASVVSLTDPLGRPATFTGAELHDLQAGVVALPYRQRGTWTVVATFDAEIPDDLRLGTLIIGKHLWDTQRSPGRGEGARPGFGPGSEMATPPMGFAIPRRALELLAPYWLPGTA